MIKKIVSFLVSLMISGVIIYMIYINNDQKWEFELSHIDLKYVALSFTLLLLSASLRSARSCILLPPYSIFPKIRTWWIIVTSISMSTIFGGIGVFFRIFFLKKRLQIPYSIASGAMIMEKIFDLLIIFLALMGISVYFPQFIPILEKYSSVGIIPLILFMLSSFFLVYYFRYYLIRLFLYLISGLSIKTNWFLKKRLVLVERNISTINSPRILIPYLIYTSLILITDVTLIYMVFKSYQITLHWGEAAIINLANQIFLLLPLSPSGIGLIQAAFHLSGILLDIDENMLLMSFFFHFVLLSGKTIFLLVGMNQMKLTPIALFEIFKNKEKLKNKN